MAITLDELLGRNKGDVEQEYDVRSFPSYGEFFARRGASDEPSLYDDRAYDARPDYDFDRRPQASAPRSAQAAREYEASRPYRAPREEEYRSAELSYRERRMPEDRGYDSGYYADDVRTNADRAPSPADVGGLYEFTRNDAERASGEELYDRLSSTGAVNESKYAAAARDSYSSEDYAAKYRAQNNTKKKVRLKLRSKLLIAAYVIVVAIVGVLIIVNAKDLNNGTAAVPSSQIVATE